MSGEDGDDIVVDSDDQEHDDDEDMDMEHSHTHLKQQLAVIEQQLKGYADSYEVHLNYVNTLRALGEFDRLTTARQTMHNKFCLAESNSIL
jgi:hypothetical protein